MLNKKKTALFKLTFMLILVSIAYLVNWNQCEQRAKPTQ